MKSCVLNIVTFFLIKHMFQGTPERSSEKGLKSLRTSRVMKKGMVITTEPGIYFNETVGFFVYIFLSSFKLTFCVNLFICITKHNYLLLQTITKAYDNPEWSKFLVKSEIDKYMNFGGVSFLNRI